MIRLNCFFQAHDGEQYKTALEAAKGVEGEAALDTKGMQTMRALGRNMAFLLKSIHSQEPIPYPEVEPWEPMHFIRQGV